MALRCRIFATMREIWYFSAKYIRVTQRNTYIFLIFLRNVYIFLIFSRNVMFFQAMTAIDLRAESVKFGSPLITSKHENPLKEYYEICSSSHLNRFLF